jgi:hypothetical protein
MAAAAGVLPSDAALTAAMEAELARPDLDWETATKKTLRTAVAQRFNGIDLEPKKALLNAVVDAFLARPPPTPPQQPPPVEAPVDPSQLSDSDLEDGDGKPTASRVRSKSSSSSSSSAAKPKAKRSKAAANGDGM